MGAALSAIALLLTWLFSRDGLVANPTLVPALAFPPHAVDHLAQGLRLRRRNSG